MKIEYEKVNNSNRELAIVSLIKEAERYTTNVREFQGVFNNLLKDYADSPRAHNQQAITLYRFKKTDVPDSLDNDDYSEITEGFIVYDGPSKFRVLCKIVNE